MARGRVPTRDELLAFIKESPTPVGKREIARAFHIKGDQRIELKQLLRDLRDNGEIAAEMNTTVKTVENQLNKGLRVLRSALKHYLFSAFPLL